jgi:hypothetical protein
MNATRINAAVRISMIPQTNASALPEVENGLIWYQKVYSQSHGCPGQSPVSFIMPHC